ncbi:excise [Mycobacterium phage Hammy]|uniref:Excise n=1 Tax=Mycobacterium phage DarthP TaxID=2015879 RepID=A0A286MRB8_9CAUD|nr:HTH DNA binding protein [Mycobacterium phage DarthP]APD18212.1 excise [Mycobacterium phage Hammy]ASW31793.1 excise [Mycobacterium phage DarthP]
MIPPVVVEVEPILLTREDTARALGLSTKEIDRLRATGDLMPRRHGRKVLFPIAELRRFAQSLPVDQLGA